MHSRDLLSAKQRSSIGIWQTIFGLTYLPKPLSWPQSQRRSLRRVRTPSSFPAHGYALACMVRIPPVVTWRLWGPLCVMSIGTLTHRACSPVGPRDHPRKRRRRGPPHSTWDPEGALGQTACIQAQKTHMSALAVWGWCCAWRDWAPSSWQTWSLPPPPKIHVCQGHRSVTQSGQKSVVRQAHNGKALVRPPRPRAHLPSDAAIGPHR